MKTIELLAPAGSNEALIGAINAGAQAIYLAGKRFGARAYAHNFDDDQMIDAINYAHMRGVFVYVAINTLIFNEELEALFMYTDFLVNHHVDALIIQDLGIIDVLIKRYPNLDIHVSTQANIHHMNQIKLLKNLGVKRIVLAREVSIDLIKKIKKEVDIEVEVFVHGALCVSYSGNCYLSLMIGGRSGNRGACAQPCRLPYQLYKNHQKITDQSYLLSTKDLMTIDYIKALIDAGVDSFKIEGRMRKHEYVIQSVLSYRRAIDYHVLNVPFDIKAETEDLTKTFNRMFTKGYLFNEEPQDITNMDRSNHLGVEIGQVIMYKQNKVSIKLTQKLHINDGIRMIDKDKEYGGTVSRILINNQSVEQAEPNEVVTLDVTTKIEKNAIVMKTSDYILEQSLKKYLDQHHKLMPIKGLCVIKLGKPIMFNLTYKNKSIQVFSKDCVEQAKTTETTYEQVHRQLNKLGQTPFYFEDLIIELDKSVFVPMIWFNELRREAIDQLTESNQKEQMINLDVRLDKKDILQEVSPTELIVKVQTMQQYETAKKLGIKTIYYQDLLNIDSSDIHIIPVRKRINSNHAVNQASSVIQEIGSLLDSTSRNKFISDVYFNVTNIHTAAYLLRHHVKAVTLSLELSRKQVYAFYDLFKSKYKTHIDLEMIVYGRPDVMISKYCPIAKTYKVKPFCHLCEKNQYFLEDRMNEKYPLINDGFCNLRILNSKPIHLIEFVHDIIESNIKRIRLDFTIESSDEMEKVIVDYQNVMYKKSKSKLNILSTHGQF